jgi:hypothetical protein
MNKSKLEFRHKYCQIWKHVSSKQKVLGLECLLVHESVYDCY